MATVFIQDITQLSKEAWREERKKGIGGSDVGAILGLNEFKSPFDVYYDKIGAKNQKPLSDKSRVTMEIGNRLEDLIADMFQEKYPSIRVVNDTTMYQHDKYHFMLANTDRMLFLPDGTRAVLECKTVTYADDWESTDFCKGIQGKCPLSYEYQGRHYMATLDIDMAVIAGLDLIRKELYVVFIDRDMDIEQQMISAEAEFWSLVENRTIPNLSHYFARMTTAVRSNAFKKFYGADKAVTHYATNAEEIEIFNEIDNLIVKQQFHSAEAQKAKEAKEELAMELFLRCKEHMYVKPSRIELNSVVGDLAMSQYITLTDTTAVNFDLQKFITAYNSNHAEKLPEDIDERTALLMGKRNMPDRLGEFLILDDKGARFYFSKRKTKVRTKKMKRKNVEN